MTINALFRFKNGKKHYRSLRGGAVPLFVLGLYAIVTGLFGQFFWPLPGAYNIVFYDVYTLVGLLFVSIAWSLRSDIETQHAGMFSLLMGFAVIYYGIEGYLADLAKPPILLLALYSLFGITGVLGYPMTVMLDRSDDGDKLKWKGWKIIAFLFFLFLLLASLLALFIVAEALPAHLMSPP
jgi:putative membrane protein